MEFLVENEHGVVPVEVKSGNNATVSLDGLLQQDDLVLGYKLIDGNIGVTGKKVTLPHYLAMFV